MAITIHKTPLQCLLTDIIDFLVANPNAINDDLGAFIIGKYKFSPDQVTNFFTVLGSTLTNTGITTGPLIDDMKVTVGDLGAVKSKALVELVAAGIRQDPSIQDEILALRKWSTLENITKINNDIVTLDAAILKAVPPVLDALDHWKTFLENEKSNLQQRLS